MDKPASTSLLRYAIRLVAARMTDSRPASTRALPLIVAPVGAFVQTGLAIGRCGDGGRSLGVAFLGGGLGLRQAHGSLRSKSKTRWQRHQQNAQHKAHDSISLSSQSFVSTHNSRMGCLRRSVCAAATNKKSLVGISALSDSLRTSVGSHRTDFF